MNWKKWSARKENNLSCSDHHSADLAKQCITQFHIFHRSVTTYPTHRRLLNSAAKKLSAIHKYKDRFLLRFMGLKEAADLLLKNYNFIKKYWLNESSRLWLPNFLHVIRCSQDAPFLKFLKNTSIEQFRCFCVKSDLDETNRAIVEKVHLKCIDFFEW